MLTIHGYYIGVVYEGGSAMHVYARSFSFNEHNVAGIRKLFSPGPLPLVPIPPAPTAAVGAATRHPGTAGVGASKTSTTFASERVAKTAAVLVPL